MIYTGPELGELKTQPYEEAELSVVEDIMDAIRSDTPEFDKMPEPLQQTFLQAVRKSAVLGLENNPSEIPVFDEEENETLLDRILTASGVWINSPYVTFHDVLRTAKIARDFTTQAINSGNVDEVGLDIEGEQ